MTAGRGRGPGTPPSATVTVRVLRAVAVAGLVLDAVIHLRLAHRYDPIGTSITQGGLFRAEAAAAVLAGVFLLIRDSRLAWFLAAAVAGAGTAAVLATRYIRIPALGPIPAMYDPQWFGAKELVTAGMAAAVAAWIARETLRYRRRQPTGPPRTNEG